MIIVRCLHFAVAFINRLYCVSTKFKMKVINAFINPRDKVYDKWSLDYNHYAIISKYIYDNETLVNLTKVCTRASAPFNMNKNLSVNIVYPEDWYKLYTHVIYTDRKEGIVDFINGASRKEYAGTKQSFYNYFSGLLCIKVTFKNGVSDISPVFSTVYLPKQILDLLLQFMQKFKNVNIAYELSIFHIFKDFCKRKLLSVHQLIDMYDKASMKMTQRNDLEKMLNIQNKGIVFCIKVNKLLCAILSLILYIKDMFDLKGVNVFKRGNLKYVDIDGISFPLVEHYHSTIDGCDMLSEVINNISPVCTLSTSTSLCAIDINMIKLIVKYLDKLNLEKKCTHETFTHETFTHKSQQCKLNQKSKLDNVNSFYENYKLKRFNRINSPIIMHDFIYKLMEYKKVIVFDMESFNQNELGENYRDNFHVILLPTEQMNNLILKNKDNLDPINDKYLYIKNTNVIIGYITSNKVTKYIDIFECFNSVMNLDCITSKQVKCKKGMRFITKVIVYDIINEHKVYVDGRYIDIDDDIIGLERRISLLCLKYGYMIDIGHMRQYDHALSFQDIERETRVISSKYSCTNVSCTNVTCTNVSSINELVYEPLFLRQFTMFYGSCIIKMGFPNNWIGRVYGDDVLYISTPRGFINYRECYRDMNQSIQQCLKTNINTNFVLYYLVTGDYMFINYGIHDSDNSDNECNVIKFIF